ncbi:dipeptide ABC transporter ATP-binding protein [Kribbella sp. NPDC003505]|uniref:dipeptide ABC transporter ATP-binding protein n=1 Tax=Kribbella sp. NPDC003505 TaxID=3154448 RepID=UPI0033BAD229
MSLLEVTGLRTAIDTPRGRIHPVDGVSFAVEAGQTLGVVGESGSGKTMTGMSIMRLLPPGGAITGGSVRLAGEELTTLDEPAMRRLRGSRIAMIFQDPLTSLNPVRTIGSQLREAYRIHVDGSRAAATARATEVLGLVGMPRPRERLDDYPHQLSGGMRQRVMIALGLMCDPKLLIADEPTTALDVSIQAQILTLIDDLKSQLSMGVLLITHDMGVIAEYADRVAVMYGGQVVEQAPVRELFEAPRHRYTQALLAAMPTLELDRNAQLATIPGAPPTLLDLAPGCRFAPRCAFAQDDCRATDPALTGNEHAHTCCHPADGGLVSTGTARGPAREPRGADSLVQLSDVHKRFRVRANRSVQAVGGVTLTIAAGETLGIVGESGCGKTTLGRMLVGLERPSDGSVSFDGRDLSAQTRAGFRRRRRDLQMMFQDSAAALDPRMTVAALIAEPLVAQGVGTRRERRHTVAELLDAVGLPPDAAERYPHEFSGGQRQRIAMARALALRPKVIVADEPVSALDVSVQAQILNLMRSLQQRFGLTYVVISHDLSLLKYLADRIGVMYLGRLVELGPGEEVYSAPRHPYTAGLINAIPVPDTARARHGAQRSTGLGGELPSAIDPPSGCHFRTRCPLATERCGAEVPVLQTDEGPHAVACHHPLTTHVLTPAR